VPFVAIADEAKMVAETARATLVIFIFLFTLLSVF